MELEPSQLAMIRIGQVGSYDFAVERQGIGNIDFDNNVFFNSNRSVPVFPPRQGTIVKILVELGDEVKTGQPLYVIDSPDLVGAETMLIGAQETRDLASKAHTRAIASGYPEKELEQAVADQHAAERAFKAAREAVHALGEPQADIDQILAAHKVDPELVVHSPIAGQITAVSASPGLLVQPAMAPAPCSVADVSTKWMLAKVAESDIPFYRVGQRVKVTVDEYPDRTFTGKVSKIYPAVDPNTHRVTIRSEIADPGNELRSGMLAEFAIKVRRPVESIAIPADGVVREGDGTMTAWVTVDRRRFVQRIVKTGLRSNGRVQILAGLRRGELVVTDGAIFLDNMLQAPPSD